MSLFRSLVRSFVRSFVLYLFRPLGIPLLVIVPLSVFLCLFRSSVIDFWF